MRNSSSSTRSSSPRGLRRHEQRVEAQLLDGVDQVLGRRPARLREDRAPRRRPARRTARARPPRAGLGARLDGRVRQGPPQRARGVQRVDDGEQLLAERDRLRARRGQHRLEPDLCRGPATPDSCRASVLLAGARRCGATPRGRRGSGRRRATGARRPRATRRRSWRRGRWRARRRRCAARPPPADARPRSGAGPSRACAPPRTLPCALSSVTMAPPSARAASLMRAASVRASASCCSYSARRAAASAWAASACCSPPSIFSVRSSSTAWNFGRAYLMNTKPMITTMTRDQTMS